MQKRKDLDVLLHKVRMAGAKEGDAKKILNALLDEIEAETGYSGRRSWDILVELIADALGIIDEPWRYSLPDMPCSPLFRGNSASLKGKRRVSDKLVEHIRKTGLIEEFIVAAKAKPHDYLGEVFMEQRLHGRRLGQVLTPMNVVNFMIQMTIGEEPKELKTVLDPCVGSGRFLLGATLAYPKAPLVLFGIEIDISLYRACLVNMALFSNHPYSIICADTLRLDIEKSGPSSPLWDYGNCWDPPDISAFYVKPPPITSEKFSLAEWMKIIKKG
jgi:hypothetical protein